MRTACGRRRAVAHAVTGVVHSRLAGVDNFRGVMLYASSLSESGLTVGDVADARVPSLRGRDESSRQSTRRRSGQPARPRQDRRSDDGGSRGARKRADLNRADHGTDLDRADHGADPDGADQKVEVRRSPRRRRTVTAYRDGDTLVVLIPATMTKSEERHWIAEMQRKLRRTENRRAAPARASDEALLLRCTELSRRYLDGTAQPASVRWVPPMRTRWASCTPRDRTIRVSERLRTVPSWVLDYVLVHELAHLRVAEHNARFWALVRRYPKTERAIGFLEGLSSAEGPRTPTPDD